MSKWVVRDEALQELERDPNEVQKIMEASALQSIIYELKTNRKTLEQVRLEIQKGLDGKGVMVSRHQAEAMQGVLELMGDDFVREYSTETHNI